MDIGVCVASQISDIDYVVEAEKLGFTDAWFADSQMLWSDCYASLALAADKTSQINIGKLVTSLLVHIYRVSSFVITH